MIFLTISAALACAVCGGGEPEATRKAFMDSTVFLSVLPPGMIAGLLLWVWRRSSQAQA